MFDNNQSNQMANAATMIGMKCIMMGLRGGAPLVIGTAGLLAVGTVYGVVKLGQGGIKGIKLLKSKYDSPEAGQNSWDKIKKASEVIVVREVDASIYSKFEETCKTEGSIGIPFAATRTGDTYHVIMDSKNAVIADSILKGLANDRRKRGDDIEPQYSQKPFEGSQWEKILEFAIEKFVVPLQGKDISHVQSTIDELRTMTKEQTADLAKEFEAWSSPEAQRDIEKSFDIESIPELKEAIDVLSTELVLTGQADKADTRALFSKIGKHLEENGVKVKLEKGDASEVIKMSFDPRDKNGIILGSKRILEDVAQGKAKGFGVFESLAQAKEGLKSVRTQPLHSMPAGALGRP